MLEWLEKIVFNTNNHMYIKPLLIAAVILALPAAGNAQSARLKDPGFKFKVIKENPITSIKDQNRSGTCWCFSATSFFESEAIRINGIKDTTAYPDFSEMFTISHSYQDRAKKYVSMDGNISFGAGSECEDVLHIIKDYGIVPNEVMRGLNYGTALPEHYEMDAVLKGAVDAVLTNPNKKLTPAWPRAIKGILDAYLGECPDSGFTYKGKFYMPASYRDSYKINPDDYVTLTSYTHHPFYSKFAIEVGDNWRQDQAYNVPLDEFWDAICYAIEHGYTMTWGGDVSEPGFTRDGVAYLVDVKAAGPMSDRQRLNGIDPEKAAVKDTVQAQPKELAASQEMRQMEFENKQSTDDHGMHAFGIAEDQWGTKYIMIKNSWGKYGKYDGILYMSENYFKEKTEDFMVNKEALPKALKAKLGIK